MNDPGGDCSIEWARARLAVGTPVILECYTHTLSHVERLEQIGWMTDSIPEDASPAAAA
jgi:hypothetical protein